MKNTFNWATTQVGIFVVLTVVLFIILDEYTFRVMYVGVLWGAFWTNLFLRQFYKVTPRRGGRS